MSHSDILLANFKVGDELFISGTTIDSKAEIVKIASVEES